MVRNVVATPTTNAMMLLLAVEMATLTREGEGVMARTIIRVLPASEVDQLISKYLEMVEAKKKADREKAAAAASSSSS